jgi:pyruvate dehydrogenase E1 component alpha subunit
MALAFKMKRTRQVAVCFFGDGAVAEGAFHEGINLAAIWSLPALFVCENNLYGASTRIDKVMKAKSIAERVSAYGIQTKQLDGNNVLAVYEAARDAVAACRNGGGPAFLELLTYRRTGHSRRDACHYQPKEERDYWFNLDPIDRLGRALVARGDVREEDLSSIRQRVVDRFTAAVESAKRQPMPTTADLVTDVLA